MLYTVICLALVFVGMCHDRQDSYDVSHISTGYDYR
jgi:hypothetical protein